MASSINASTSGAGGVITTADNTGILNLQSAGTTVAAVSSTGVAITGTLSASGEATISGLTVGKGGGSIASNTALGASALSLNTTAVNNTAVGYQALSNSTTSNGNTAFGYQALVTHNGTGGTYSNTAVGVGALSGVTNGYVNTAIGPANTGSTITGGTYNTYIGNANASAVGASGELVVGSGNGQKIGKGTDTAFISANTGGTYNGANTTTWATTSDQRLKKNIIDNTDGLNKITAIQVRNFEYRLPEEVTELESQNAIDKQGIQLGVIAQELQQILPECVTEESTGVLSVQTDNLVWYLINAIKEQQALITSLTARITALEGASL
jgi:hypothetical protein